MEQPNPHHTDDGAALTRVMLTVFRANGALLSAGEHLARQVGLTSSRWQVLGAVELADRPLTVPQIARRMGLARQSVHATVRVLIAHGLLRRLTNADHQRSALVTSTADGREVYQSLQARQAAWVNALAAEWDVAELRAAGDVLDALVGRLLEPPARPTNEGETADAGATA